MTMTTDGSVWLNCILTYYLYHKTITYEYKKKTVLSIIAICLLSFFAEKNYIFAILLKRNKKSNAYIVLRGAVKS